MRAGPLLALALLGACRARSGAEQARPNFLLIDVDSMRADRLLAERGGRPIAPRLAALAARGVRFEHAVSQAGWTQPALAALLTGTWPPAIEQRRAEKLTWVPEGTRTLPQVLGWYGYRSAAVWGQTLPQAFPELSAGFDEVYQADERETWVPGGFLDAWLDDHAREPFLLLVHEFDLHCPRPPAPDAWVAPWAEPLPRADDPCLHGLMHRWGPRLPAEILRPRLVAHYDAGLAYYDDLVGRMLARLDREGLLARTTIVLLSDHGEELFERGVIGHGTQYETVLRVPLVVVDPARPAAGLVRDEIVQTVDLPPTLLELAGVPADHQMVGRSLVPLLAPGEAAWSAREVYSLTDRDTASVQVGDLKLVTRRRAPEPVPGAGPATERRGAWVQAQLFDLAADPGEQRDRSAEDPDRTAELRSLLRTWMTERLIQAGAAPGLDLGPEQRKKLQDGGYWEVIRRR